MKSDIVQLQSNQNNAAIDDGKVAFTLVASMGLGGGVRGVDCESTVGALCYDDYKGLNRQAVEQGKWVVEWTR